jgi:trimeric autotransporter adhesin
MPTMPTRPTLPLPRTTRSLSRLLGIPLLLAALGLLMLAPAAVGQTCGGQWMPSANTLAPGVSGSINAMIQRRNGEVVVAGNLGGVGLGGSFERVAAWNGSAWRSLGPLPQALSTGTPRTIIELANGDLLMSISEFTNGDNSHVLRWNGATWSQVGEAFGRGRFDPFNTFVRALAELPNGDLVAAGGFTTVGTAAINRVARWDGTSWKPMGSGLTTSVSSPSIEARSLAVRTNGDLIVAGTFASAGGTPAAGVARWDGAAWSAFDAGLLGRVRTNVIPGPNDGLFLASPPEAFGFTSTVFRWNGSAWVGINGAFDDNRTRLAIASNGDLLWTTGISEPRLFRWNGTEITRTNVPIGNPPPSTGLSLSSVAPLADGTVMVAGAFGTINGVPAGSMALLNGSSWRAISQGFRGSISLMARQGRDVVVAGGFTSAPNAAARTLARWNGAQWLPLGAGVDGSVTLLHPLPNGELLVGGRFTQAGGQPNKGFAVWNGTGWRSILNPARTTTSSSGPLAAVNLPNGDLLVAGGFLMLDGVSVPGFARWDGQRWYPFGTGSATEASLIYSMLVTAQGELAVGGIIPRFAGAEFGNIIVGSLTGTGWRSLGAGTDQQINSLVLAPGGDIIAGGNFLKSGGAGTPTRNRIARWDGSAWNSVGAGFDFPVNELMWMPNGDLLAVGGFTNSGSTVVNRIARFNGTNWQGFGTGLNATVSAAELLPSGDLVVGGGFTEAGGMRNVSFARWSPTGAPWVAVEPASQIVSAGQRLTLSATPAEGCSNVSVQWFRNGQPISDGPGGASSGGGVVSGASTVLASPTASLPAVLVIDQVACGDAGIYHAQFSNACGSATTVQITANIGPCLASIPADYDRDGQITLDDLCDFITDFYAQPAIPGGVQAMAPQNPGIARGFGVACPAAPDAPLPYDAAAYRMLGYRVGFSADGSNVCPTSPDQLFPNLDHLAEYITLFYAGSGA